MPSLGQVMENGPVLPAFLLCSTLLVIKMYVVGVITGYTRLRKKAPTDRAAPAPPTAADDTMFLGVVPSPDADLTSMVSPQSCDAGNGSDLMEETKTFSSTESLRPLSQQLNRHMSWSCV